jgi:hypothetical protein
VFNGLLPEKYNKIVLNLLFELATWHGLVKLCLHTETILQDLDNSTARFGKILCKFKSIVCTQYDTCELPLEEAAHGCWEARKAAKAQSSTSAPPSA